jgi:hypothetical protein
MTTFLLDLWHDLREKRLWPVAAAILLATAAVPILLFKPASTPAGSSTPNTTSKGLGSLPVVTMAETTGKVSKLDTFGEKNPFKPLNDIAKPPTEPTAGSSTGSTSSGGGSASGGSGGSGGGPNGGGGAPGGSPTSVTTTHTTTSSTTLFAFHVDVSFGERGHEKTYKDVKQLGMFPDDKDPVAVFMGMSSDGKKAVFLVDSAKYSADGEGSCQPSAKSCTFVTLGVSDSTNEETLASTDGSSEYTLKLLKINRVPLDQPKASKSNGSAPKRKGKAKVARHERRAAEALSRFIQASVFGGQG